MKRSDFIKSSCTACAFLALPGITSLLMESCASIPTYKTKPDLALKECLIPIEKFVDSKILILRMKGFAFDFVVIKKDDNTYKTFQLKCTHQEQPLSVSNKNLFCSSHGSIFNFEGIPINEPATIPLRTYKTDLQNNNIVISLV